MKFNYDMRMLKNEPDLGVCFPVTWDCLIIGFWGPTKKSFVDYTFFMTLPVYFF